MKSFVKTIKELWKDPMGRIGIVGVVLLILKQTGKGRAVSSLAAA